MKLKIRISILLIAILITTPLDLIHAVCTHKDNEHVDKSVARCWYTQKDLNRIYANNPERNKEMKNDGTVCFFCGCDLKDHTEI